MAYSSGPDCVRPELQTVKTNAWQANGLANETDRDREDQAKPGNARDRSRTSLRRGGTAQTAGMPVVVLMTQRRPACRRVRLNS